jgi:hypothetical protein
VREQIDERAGAAASAFRRRSRALGADRNRLLVRAGVPARLGSPLLGFGNHSGRPPFRRRRSGLIAEGAARDLIRAGAASVCALWINDRALHRWSVPVLIRRFRQHL